MILVPNPPLPLLRSWSCHEASLAAVPGRPIQPRRNHLFVSMDQTLYLLWYSGLSSTGPGAPPAHYFSSLTLTKRICPA